MNKEIREDGVEEILEQPEIEEMTDAEIESELPEDELKFESMLQQSISEEYEASANYLKRAGKLEEHGMTEEAKIFRDIANEELAHIGEFQVILEKHGLSPKEQIEQGEEEAHEIINPTTPAEDEIVDLPESVNEASKIAVHAYKSGSGNMNYSAASIKDAIAYVKKQELDLANGDYFDIHSGSNTSEISGLELWGGTGGYWSNVLNNPATKDKVKSEILAKEIKSLEKAVKIPIYKMPYTVTTDGASGHSLEFQYATLDQAKKDAEAFRKTGPAIIRFSYYDENGKLHTEIVSESAQKNEAVNAAKVKQDVQNAISAYFKNDKDALEYVYVDSKKDEQGRTIIEVRAELDYNGMTKLADHLDKVVQKYDKYAYFEQESGGIMTAVFESAQTNEDIPNNSNSLPYVVANSRLQPIEYFEDVRTANDYIMSIKKKSGIKIKDLDMFIYRTNDLRKDQIQRYGKVLESAQINKDQEKTVNEEFLDKGEIYARIIRILDLTSNEDTKAVSLLSDITNFLDVDQAQKFYEFIQEETEMNYDEIFGSKEETNEDGSIAGLGSAPTVAAGQGYVEIEPTEMCEELKALKEALKR